MNGKDKILSYCLEHTSPHYVKHINNCKKVIDFLKSADYINLANGYCPCDFGLNKNSILCSQEKLDNPTNDEQEKQCILCWTDALNSEQMSDILDITDDVYSDEGKEDVQA